MLTVKHYDQIFEQERHREYPIVDMYERMHGYAIDRVKLENMARTLACPVKRNPPNWQHGRVLYATLRAFIDQLKPTQGQICVFLDIGTAKGFSACVMSRAIADAKKVFVTIVSIDVVDPSTRILRNSVAELDGPKTIDEFTKGHLIENDFVMTEFLGCGSTSWLKRASERIPFAFVDGKHTYEQVAYETTKLRALQQAGDIIMFDDCQIEPVGRAVRDMTTGYNVRYVDIGPRIYAIAVRQ